jgi:hypothetical protein
LFASINSIPHCSRNVVMFFVVLSQSVSTDDDNGNNDQ